MFVYFHVVFLGAHSTDGMQELLPFLTPTVQVVMRLIKSKFCLKLLGIQNKYNYGMFKWSKIKALTGLKISGDVQRCVFARLSAPQNGVV